MEIHAPKPFKEKKPSGRPPAHTQEFMAMVGRKVVDEGMPFREAAKLFGVSHGTIWTWKKMYLKKNWGNASKKKTKDTDEVRFYRFETQIKELKTQIGELYLETLMLKKALEHFQTVRKENTSIITSENLEQLQRGAK